MDRVETGPARQNEKCQAAMGLAPVCCKEPDPPPGKGLERYGAAATRGLPDGLPLQAR
jgi:hypothetical protein